MKVTTLRSEPFSVNLHLVDVDGECLLVDAGTGGDHSSVEKQLRSATDPSRVRKLYLTHWHVDHVGGAAALQRLTGAEALMHADEAHALEKGDDVATLARWSGLRVEPCTVTRVREGDVVEVGGHRFEVLLVPGHSPAHTALYEPESKSLFGGDLVFAMGGFGRVDFPGCDPTALLRSLARVAAMDVENLYPGHMEPVEGEANAAIAWSLENAREMLGGRVA